jgi:predicted phage-related endonuclease
VNAPVKIETDAEFRARVVGASEVAALFGVSPWLTHFELWHRKNGTIATPEFNARNVDGSPVNSRIHWGVKLENLIIQEACERWGYEPVETPGRVDNGAGLGGHPDRVVWCPERKAKVVLEAKSVDWLQRKKWGDEPPTQYLLQPNTYAGLLGAERFDVVTMVLGGNTDIERSQNAFRPRLYAETERMVVEFWASVRAGKPPKPDYSRDGATIQEVIGEPTEALIDLTRNNRAGLLAADFLDAKARMKAAETEMEAAKAEMLELIGDAGLAQLEGYRIACGMTKGSAGTLITEEMVGTHVGGRKGWRRFDLKELA